ncbi:redoxin domain-containing protein [Halococcus saccharolyticus]|uniref:Bacterioferritin comigrating protein n=1 Tax=Halococcus saccharolyticus DSM 5350 TaxID=1227455 RepID=M0MHT4_9EURY|nr:redoxin domain-containing protein [Halococcus saccharolyticus]EMA43975.1 bacterioferritin comigrating protein [Halococcus saccharolyticus DSM 5350]
MVSDGDSAPDFTAKLAGDEPEEFTLSEQFGEAPLVLAFFPGAFTPPCTNEMVAFQDDLDALRETGATLYGISADSPFSQAAFQDEHGLEFDLVSDMDRAAIEAYDVSLDIDDLGLQGVAERAVFVIDGDGTVTYSWVADDPTNEPDYDAVYEAAEAAA